MDLQRFHRVFTKAIIVAAMFAVPLGVVYGLGGALTAESQFGPAQSIGIVLVDICWMLTLGLALGLLVTLVDQILLRFGK
jgi:hypothetical protein